MEHPERIAERLVRFAERVGRDNVIAGVDCGFSSQATHRTEVHPTVIREKFRALRWPASGCGAVDAAGERIEPANKRCPRQLTQQAGILATSAAKRAGRFRR